MKKFYMFLAQLLISANIHSQQIPLPADLPQSHPRLMTTAGYKAELQKQLTDEPWAKDVMEGILNRINLYVDKTQAQPDWMYSRLMMYWKSKATQVYIKGGVYSHADGEAPAPTVRFGSTRGVSSVYKRPKIDDIIPYMDDIKGVYFHNSAKEGNPLEWTEQANVSGANIESVNEEIMRYAKDASFVYWVTDDVKYAKFAFDLFDTYMTGMYYRSEPIDLLNSHAQTLVGLSTFEVIQERILNELSYTYDFLWNYISDNHKDRLSMYAATFKKWIDVSIKNGVPHNNWNLHKSKFILKVAMVLEDNSHYTDGKGREYYIDYILNKSMARQWSLSRFMAYGFDSNTGIWNECPGYAQSVVHELTMFIRDYDNTFNQSLLPYTPVMYKAVEGLPQYLFPNGQTSAFGDSYYGNLNREPISDMIRLAQKHGDRENEVRFTKMLKLFAQNNEQQSPGYDKLSPQVASFFTGKPLVLENDVPEGKLNDYVTPVFYAPNVSWLVQRNKFDDAHNGLMISQYGSFGNHMHANGLAIELYGKGYILGAESGIGSSYFEKPYLEYYSQFPAHNTVMVDGISKYPEMLSNHPFDLLACYPQSGQKDGYYPNVTYSEAYFLEPESRSDQNRFLSIVRTDETSGYYIDIFRSKKQRGGDRYHDYFYHNLGQELFVQDKNGTNMNLKPSDEMDFAGGHLFALDYMWDKQSAKTNDDYRAVWKMTYPDGNNIYMNLWMKGYEGREIFTIKASPVKSFRSNDAFPYEANKAPYLTIAARQHGEAWSHPFVAIYEPTNEAEGKSIVSIDAFTPCNSVSSDFVGLIVKSISGRTDYIFSSINDEKVQYNNMSVNGSYVLVSETGKDFTLFMGNATSLAAKGFGIEAKVKTNAVLEFKNGEYFFAGEAPVIITTAKGKKIKFEKTDYQKIKL